MEIEFSGENEDDIKEGKRPKYRVQLNVFDMKLGYDKDEGDVVRWVLL